jgi:hypothetical protein
VRVESMSSMTVCPIFTPGEYRKRLSRSQPFAGLTWFDFQSCKYTACSCLRAAWDLRFDCEIDINVLRCRRYTVSRPGDPGYPAAVGGRGRARVSGRLDDCCRAAARGRPRSPYNRAYRW